MNEIELQKEIIRLLINNNGKIKEKTLCELLSITSYEIPWGYNVGYARCLQSNQEYYLMLSGHYNEWN